MSLDTNAKIPIIPNFITRRIDVSPPQIKDWSHSLFWKLCSSNNQRICVEIKFVQTNHSLAEYYVNLSCMPFVIFILFNIDVQM